MIDEREEKAAFDEWLADQCPEELVECTRHSVVREAWFQVWKGCARAKQEQIGKLKEAAEVHWLVAHDLVCDEDHECTSFAGEKHCVYTRRGGFRL